MKNKRTFKITPIQLRKIVKEEVAKFKNRRLNEALSQKDFSKIGDAVASVASKIMIDGYTGSSNYKSVQGEIVRYLRDNGVQGPLTSSNRFELIDAIRQFCKQ